MYYQPVGTSQGDMLFMNLLDAQYTRTPFWGVRNMTTYLRSQGYQVGKDHVRTLLRRMGLEAIFAKPNLSKPHPQHKIYPYLLKDVDIVRPNQVWSADITYVRLAYGFAYLVVLIDWYSRYVLSWRLSNTLDSSFCQEALSEALDKYGRAEIFNSDQGSQFTSTTFTDRLATHGVAISMDGRGRAIDNVFVERLWRSVKYEEVYLKDYANGWEAESNLASYFQFYCHERIHQSLGYRTPAEVYGKGS